jgi:hypothetical protein
MALRELVPCGRQVRHMNRHTIDHRTPCDPLAAEGPTVEINRDRTPMCAHGQEILISEEDNSVIGPAEVARSLEDCLENRLKVAR